MSYYISIIGSGIMGAIISLILFILNKNYIIIIFEINKKLSKENSKVLNNAGTGHAGMCENNYTKKINNNYFIKKNLRVNYKFELTKNVLTLIKYFKIINIKKIISNTPHILYFYLNNNIKKLKNIFKKKKKNNNLYFTKNILYIKRIYPILLKYKKIKKNFTITYYKKGLDINYELLSKKIFNFLSKNFRLYIYLNKEVKKIKKKKNFFIIYIKNKIFINNIFICSGGTSLNIMKSLNKLITKKYLNFPIRGVWAINENKKIIKLHNLKVYSQTLSNNPPMSIPHLDNRKILNENKILFGPFSGLTFKILINNNFYYFVHFKDFINLIYFSFKNFNLIKYLIKDNIKTKKKKSKNIVPFGIINKFYYKNAGKRLQIIKKKKNVISLILGTKLIFNKNKKVIAIIGASPGASISAQISKKINFYWNKKNFLNYNNFKKKIKILNTFLHLKGIEPSSL